MTHTILLDEKEVRYNLERKKVKNINLRVKPDGSIYVSANNSVSQEKIEKFLIEKSEFIFKALEHYREIQKYAAKPKQYIDGEHFKICGHDLRLKVSQGAKNHIENDGVYIKLTVKDINDFGLKQKTMDKWIKEQCVSTISMVCEAVYPKFQKYGVKFPMLKFRKMISRWGKLKLSIRIKTLYIFTKSLSSVKMKYILVNCYNFGDVVVTALCDIFAVYR